MVDSFFCVVAKDIVNDIINYIAQFPTSDNYMTRRRDKLFSPLDFRCLLSLILVVHNFFKGQDLYVAAF